MHTIAHWIEGRRSEPAGTDVAEVRNPASGELLGTTKEATKAERDRALAAAKTAQAHWAKQSTSKRSSVLFAFRKLVVENANVLATCISTEQGKLVKDAEGEVARGLEVVDFACGIPQSLSGTVSMQAATDLDVFSYREPMGVVTGITPFNFPFMIPLWMSSLAIATGNAFILKPAAKDPSVSLLIAEMWRDAGLPEGIFQVLQGDRVTAEALITHPDIAAVSFVGSTPIAEKVHLLGRQHLKRVQAFGGAKNHAVVLDDADLTFTARNLVAAAFGAAGQRCMALPVVLVQESIADALLEQVEDQTRQVRVGAGNDPDVDMGPVITPDSLERITQLIDDAEQRGARVRVDGRGLVVSGCEDGYFIGPTVVDQVSPDMPLHIQEVFGPVLEVIRVKDLTQAMDLVNANPYGNGATLFTSSGSAARRFHTTIEAGMIGINVPIPVPVAWHSFGGRKASSFADHNMFGVEGVQFYTSVKTVTQRWPDPQEAGDSVFHFPAGNL